MDSINQYISNGTCYYAEDTPSDLSFIPCGNDADGHKSCCGAGDMCLSSNACFNAEFGITYLIGCSDPEYQADVCPDKKGVPNGGWVGLVTCGGTNNWAACAQTAKPSTLTTPDACSCPKTSATVAFIDAPTLTNIVSLPTEMGESVEWQIGYNPTPKTSTSTPSPAPASTVTLTATPSPSSLESSASTTTSSPSSSPTPVTIVATTTETPLQASDSPSNSLSTGAKVGIGVGVGFGALAILAALIFFIVRRTRRQRERQDEEPQYTSINPTDTKYPIGPSTPGTIATSAVSELDSTAARPWSLRSELPGVESPSDLGSVFEDQRVSDARAGEAQHAGGGGLGVHSQGHPKLETWAELEG